MDSASLSPFVQQQLQKILDAFHEPGTFNNITVEYKRHRILVSAFHVPRATPVKVEIKHQNNECRFSFWNLKPNHLIIGPPFHEPPAPLPEVIPSATVSQSTVTPDLPSSTSNTYNPPPNPSTGTVLHPNPTPIVKPEPCTSSNPPVPDVVPSATTSNPEPVLQSSSSSSHEPAWAETATYIDGTVFDNRHLAGTHIAEFISALIDDDVLTTSLESRDDRLVLSFSFFLDSPTPDTVTARFQSVE